MQNKKLKVKKCSPPFCETSINMNSTILFNRNQTTKIWKLNTQNVEIFIAESATKKRK